EYLTDLYNEISSISKTGETATNYQLNLLEEKLQNYIKNMSDYRGKKNNNVDSGDSKNAMTTA
ncbi:MAG: hypothetical protein SOV49_03635, partial [Erysipelotrichaceae bacterium]|nr:hypothetical protein [Erysipelotrichaceae bacterium]